MVPAMRGRQRAVLGLVVAMISCSAARARADHMPGFWPAGAGGSGDPHPFELNFDFFAQVEVGATFALANFSDFGGLGGKLTLDVEGVGGAVGGRWERDAPGDGGLAFVEAQLRPFELAEWRMYRLVDPYFALGSELGSSPRGVRRTGYGGVGVDVALWPSDTHPAFTAQYSYRLPQAPAGFAPHVLSIGLSLRSVF
jgi:hypothetical protein